MRKRIYYLIGGPSHETNISLYYDRFMFVCIFASLLPLCFKEMTPMLEWLDRITVCIFIIDYILRWITADYKYKGEGIKAFLKYPFGRFAIIDLLAILPSLKVLNKSFKLIKLLKLGKLLRIFKLLHYSKSLNLIIRIFQKERRELAAVCIFAVAYIFATALIMFRVEPQTFGNFFDAVYWSVVTLTTIGYGDIHPVSEVGRFIGMLSSLVGIAVVALPTGFITAGYMSELSKEKGHKESDSQEMSGNKNGYAPIKEDFTNEL